MNLRIITKNRAADLEIGFLKKSFSKPNGLEAAMPTAWKLKLFYLMSKMCDIFRKRLSGANIVGAFGHVPWRRSGQFAFFKNQREQRKQRMTKMKI